MVSGGWVVGPALAMTLFLILPTTDTCAPPGFVQSSDPGQLQYPPNRFFSSNHMPTAISIHSVEAREMLDVAVEESDGKAPV